jgi:hypothetical protein
MPRVNKDTVSRNRTFALSDNAKQDKKAKTTVPDGHSVKEARDWVDHNKK